VFENRVLRRIFGLKKDEVIGGLRKPHNLYSLPSIIRMIKSRRMIWGRSGMHIDYWWESQTKRVH
jgi:hypothetical protein